MQFKAWFWRAAQSVSELGPQNEFVTIEARSRTAATKDAKAIAKEKGWRFMEVEPVNAEQPAPMSITEDWIERNF